MRAQSDQGLNCSQGWIQSGFREFSRNIHTYYVFLSIHAHPSNKSILLPGNDCKNAGLVANSIDPDQTPRPAASDQGLRCLLRPNT